MLGPGLLLLVLLLYSLPSGLTVTENMRLSAFYRLSIWLILNLHFYQWFSLFLGLYTQDEFACLFAIVFCFLALVSWNGLCSDLNSLWHFLYLILFGTHFSLMAFSFYFLLENQMHLFVWWVGFFSLFLTIVYSLWQFIVQNEAAMAWGEHMSFIAYAMTFIAFAWSMNE
jgi:hypothetical protein